MGEGTLGSFLLFLCSLSNDTWGKTQGTECLLEGPRTLRSTSKRKCTHHGKRPGPSVLLGHTLTRQDLGTSGERDEMGTQVLSTHLQPSPLCHLRAEALDRMLSERPSIVAPRAPPHSSSTIFCCLTVMYFSWGDPFQSPPTLTFL